MAVFETQPETNITPADLHLAMDDLLGRKDLQHGADSVEYFLPGKVAVGPEERSYNAVSRLDTKAGEPAYLWEMTAPGIGFGKLLFFKDDRAHCLEGDPEELKARAELITLRDIDKLPVLTEDKTRKIYDEVSNEGLQSRREALERYYQERRNPRRGADRILSLLLPRIGPPV
jgi:hypothetical protein